MTVLFLLLSVALLLSASTIDKEEAAKLMEEMAAEVKAEKTALPKNNVSKPSSTKDTVAVPRKTANPKDGASKPVSKVASRTVKKTNASSSVPNVRPTVPGRSPVTSRRNPIQVHFFCIHFPKASLLRVPECIFDKINVVKVGKIEENSTTRKYSLLSRLHFNGNREVFLSQTYVYGNRGEVFYVYARYN